MMSRTRRPASLYQYVRLLFFKALRSLSGKTTMRVGILLCCVTLGFLFGVSTCQGSQNLAETAAILPKPIAIRNEAVSYPTYDVCFVSCIYAKSKESADKPADVSALRQANPSFQYFLYTNLEDMDTPGWTKIVKQFSYRRYITQSRWGKFMSWKDPEMQACQTIFYFDGHFEPKKVSADVFRAEADSIRRSKFGLAQIKRGHSVMDEFQMILNKKKDIPVNVDAAIKWLQAQPDFNPQCTMYANCFFGKSSSHHNHSHKYCCDSVPRDRFLTTLLLLGFKASIQPTLTFDKRRNSCGAITPRKRTLGVINHYGAIHWIDFTLRL
jgi:hypothetical protein